MKRYIILIVAIAALCSSAIVQNRVGAKIEVQEFEKIFLTAAKIYPNDEVAQNNALATEIRRGNTDSLKDVAELVNYETNSAELANSFGVYCMLTGDYPMADYMLHRALELGCERAESNLEQLTLKFENLAQIEEAEAFRVKIYGE